MTLKARYDKAVQARAIAQAKNEQAEARFKELLDELHTIYKVSSKEEAIEKVKAIEAEISELSNQIQQALEEVGA